jgi:hypothetical protein
MGRACNSNSATTENNRTFQLQQNADHSNNIIRLYIPKEVIGYVGNTLRRMEYKKIILELSEQRVSNHEIISRFYVEN